MKMIYRDTADWWVGLYRGPHHLYVCPVPTVVIKIRRKIMNEIPIRVRCSGLCAVHCPGHSAGGGWDPVPYLAALIDGLHAFASSAADGPDFGIVASLVTGPYTALRGGLLLDVPGREDVTTEAALREVLP